MTGNPNLTLITENSVININNLVCHINTTAKCNFCNVSYKEVGNAIVAIFIIYDKNITHYYEDTAIAFLDGIYIWASTDE